MTSEIKPEDVKLPEPMRIMVGVEGFQFQALDVTVFTADQVRAAVLEERERALREVAKVKEWLSDKEAPFGWAVEDRLDACAAAIRAGHSITETQRD